MKRTALILAFLLTPLISYAYQSPGKATGFVNDFAHVLSDSDKANIESVAKNIEDTTGSQVAVAIISSLGNETIDSYAPKLFSEWGIGQKGKDNGILILVSIAERKARVEVGYGLEGTVTDLQAGNIVQDIMIPQFKTGNYGEGIYQAVSTIGKLIQGDPTVQYALNSSGNSSSNSRGNNSGNGFTFIAVLVIWGIGILSRLLARSRSWWFGGVIGALVGVIVGFIYGFVPFGIFWIIFLTIFGLFLDYMSSKNPPGGGKGGFWPIIFGGGRRGGFGGGGGFGGFGGGSSGGGGASGGW